MEHVKSESNLDSNNYLKKLQPFSEFLDALKALLIFVCFSIVILYFVVYPFIVAKRENQTKKLEKAPEYQSLKSLVYKSIIADAIIVLPP